MSELHEIYNNVIDKLPTTHAKDTFIRLIYDVTRLNMYWEGYKILFVENEQLEQMSSKLDMLFYNICDSYMCAIILLVTNLTKRRKLKSGKKQTEWEKGKETINLGKLITDLEKFGTDASTLKDYFGLKTPRKTKKREKNEKYDHFGFFGNRSGLTIHDINEIEMLRNKQVAHRDCVLLLKSKPDYRLFLPTKEEYLIIEQLISKINEYMGCFTSYFCNVGYWYSIANMSDEKALLGTIKRCDDYEELFRRYPKEIIEMESKIRWEAAVKPVCSKRIWDPYMKYYGKAPEWVSIVYKRYWLNFGKWYGL